MIRLEDRDTVRCPGETKFVPSQVGDHRHQPLLLLLFYNNTEAERSLESQNNEIVIGLCYLIQFETPVFLGDHDSTYLSLNSTSFCRNKGARGLLPTTFSLAMHGLIAPFQLVRRPSGLFTVPSSSTPSSKRHSSDLLWTGASTGRK